MKTRLAIFFVLWVVLMTALIAYAAPPPVLPPIQRNFFTTNPAPVVAVLAGSNATVQATTVGTDTRNFTVNARTDTNVVNILIGGGGTASFATNAINATNFWGLLSATNLPAGLSTSNYVGTFTGTGDGITNTAGYSVGSMADTNWVLNQLASYGSYLYFGGPTNTFAITNSGETVSRTNVWTGSTAPFSTAATSSVSGLTLNAYVRHVISTNTFSVIEAGPVSITTFPFKSGGGTPQIHYEFYAVDSVSNIMYELAVGPATQITATVPTMIQTSLTLTNSFVATNRCYFAIAAKVDAVGAGNTLFWAHGGAYGAHATFVRPLSSATINASQIVGVLPAGTVCGTTNTADGWVIGNTNQVRMWTQNGGALTNLNGTNIKFGTNLASQAPDLSIPYAALTTNDVFIFAAPANSSATLAQTAVVFLTNSTAAAKAITAHAAWKTQGTWYVTNVTAVTIFNWAQLWTNAIAFPLW